ncbi:hypothetical protein C8R43DRAFT_942660 [Mycena crocata]|nr:hypothetical protein C8R43DRAFT_942660 [Mycena crocata]
MSTDLPDYDHQAQAQWERQAFNSLAGTRKYNPEIDDLIAVYAVIQYNFFLTNINTYCRTPASGSRPPRASITMKNHLSFSQVRAGCFGSLQTKEPPLQWIPRPVETNRSAESRNPVWTTATSYASYPTPSSSTNPKGSDPFQSPPDSYTLLEFSRAALPVAFSTKFLMVNQDTVQARQKCVRMRFLKPWSSGFLLQESET